MTGDMAGGQHRNDEVNGPSNEVRAPQINGSSAPKPVSLRSQTGVSGPLQKSKKLPLDTADFVRHRHLALDTRHFFLQKHTPKQILPG